MRRQRSCMISYRMRDALDTQLSAATPHIGGRRQRDSGETIAVIDPAREAREDVHARHPGFGEPGIGGEDGRWGLHRNTQIKTAHDHHGDR
jgi:hypothetical protein